MHAAAFNRVRPAELDACAPLGDSNQSAQPGREPSFFGAHIKDSDQTVGVWD